MNAFHSVLRAAAAAVALVASLPAQNDRIVLVDGKVIEKCTVTSFDLRKTEYRRGASSDSVESDLVASLRVDKVRDVYRRGYAEGDGVEAPGTFVTIADAQKDKFLGQFGYFEAARILLDNGQFADAFPVLEALATTYPDSGFIPMLYRAKLDYYIGLGKGKAGDAATVARKYEDEATTKGYPKGFQLEARYYSLIAQAMGGGIDADKLQRELNALASEASGYANVANRCRMVVADVYAQSKKGDEAFNIYKDLLGKSYLDPIVRASALRGVGDVEFNRGTPGDKEPFRRALLSYLRVYVDVSKASPAITAESLYKGAQAAEKWGGEDSGMITRRLRYLLRRDHPDSEWARR